jgi:hypothetical protein
MATSLHDQLRSERVRVTSKCSPALVAAVLLQVQRFAMLLEVQRLVLAKSRKKFGKENLEIPPRIGALANVHVDARQCSLETDAEAA